MNKNQFSTIFAASLLLFFCVAISAQTEEVGKNEFGAWGGFSPDSSTIFPALGRTEDARFGIVSARYARRFNNSDAINLKYTFDATPLAVLSDKSLLPVLVPIGTGVPIRQERETYYGAGLAPLGLQINFRPRKKTQPFIGGSGGFLYFNKTLQDGFGTRFNYTADIGGGVEFRLREGRAFTVGYKYFHVSNGKRGIVNPGIDNNLFYVGYSFSR